MLVHEDRARVRIRVRDNVSSARSGLGMMVREKVTDMDTEEGLGLIVGQRTWPTS